MNIIKDKEIKFVIDGKELGGFVVYPKTDCPHLLPSQINSLNLLLEDKKDIILSNSCSECQDQSENWLCLECHLISCSREVKGHMAKHNTETSHSIALSFFDGSFWCYNCDSYIITAQLEALQRKFSAIKFPEVPKVKKVEEKKEEDKVEEKKVEEKKVEEKKVDEPLEKKEVEVKKEEVKNEEKLDEAFDKLNITESKFSYQDLIEGIKTKKYNKIAFLTGAGISVSAGIPDFRSPGTGLYSKLQNYNLPYPEAIFELGYFRKNPKAFYTLSNGFLTAEVKPTTSHFLQKMISDMGVLVQSFTQNIDSLELEAGLPEGKLCQAHGHMRSCHCINCHKEMDINKMMESIKTETIYKCECNGLVKPDIVFFGEKLPIDFFQKSLLLKHVDLVIVMGTSLVVFPFASLISMIPKEVPIVLINRDESLQGENNYLFMGGDLDENVEKMVKDLGMQEQYEKIKKEALAKFEKKKE